MYKQYSQIQSKLRRFEFFFDQRKQDNVPKQFDLLNDYRENLVSEQEEEENNILSEFESMMGEGLNENQICTTAADVLKTQENLTM